MKKMLLLLSSITLIACTQPADDPKTVADKYWQLLNEGKTLEAEKLVSINSRRDFSQHINRVTKDTPIESGDSKTIVSTTITTTNPQTNYSTTKNFDTVLVLEQGQWKIDIPQTKIPASPSAQEEELNRMAEELSKTMQHNIDSIDEAMNEGMHLLNEVLRDGSTEMGNSLMQLMNELNQSMQESIDRMKERRQQNNPQPPAEDNKPQPDPDQGEGMI